MPSPIASVSVRPAAAADLGKLCELLAVLFAQETDFEPDTARQSRALSMLIEEEGAGRIYCAVQAGEVVGMVSLLFTVSTAEGGRAAWLEDLIVQPEQRGKGVGELLLATAIAGARAAGCSRITLLTDADNAAARWLYGRAGFTSSAMVPLRLKL